MRRLDEVLAHGKRADAGKGHLCKPIPVKVMEDARVIWAENAAAYFYETADKVWDPSRDFPTLAPPLKNFFVEHRVPGIRGAGGEAGGATGAVGSMGGLRIPLWYKEFREDAGIRSTAPVNSPGGYGDRWGFLFATADLAKEVDGPVDGRPELTIVPGSGPETIRRLFRQDLRARRNIRWLVDVVSFIGKKGMRPVGPYFWWRILLDPEGKIPWIRAGGGIPEGYGLRASYAASGAGFTKLKGTPEYGALMSGMLLPSLFAISLMNCKNVTLDEQEPHEKASRNWERKHGRPLTRYHLLEIGEVRTSLSREGRAKEDGLKKALHVCRGHFKTYTQERKLFGKHEGTFWWPEHRRGSPERGEVQKDYAPRPARRREPRAEGVPSATPSAPSAAEPTGEHAAASPIREPGGLRGLWRRWRSGGHPANDPDGKRADDG